MVKKKKKFEINNGTILQRDPDQEFTYIDGEVVMLSLNNGEYYGLDEVGTRIWELLEEPRKYEDLIKDLINEYDIREEVCKEDTKNYLEELYNKKLVRI